MKKNFDDMKTKKEGIMAISRKDITSKSRTRNYGYTSETLAASKVYRAQDSEEQDTIQGSRLQSTPYVKKRSSRPRKYLLLILIIVCILACVYACSTVFQSAHIVINEKHQTFTLDHQQFTASKDQTAPLHFDIMIVSDTEFTNMNLTQSANVSLKAQGTVTIYNQYSTKPVTLGLHTYIADSSGKTYLTDKAVTVPGYVTSKTDKTQITPGAATVTVTALLSGDSYNSTSTDFTITAYKNTTKFTKIYARATAPLSGGAQGLTYTLTPEQQGILDAQAQSSFKDTLMKKVAAEVPTGYILYSTASQFSYHVDPAFSSPTANAKIPTDGTVSAVILRKDDVALALIQRLLPDSTSKEIPEIQLEDMQNLSYGFTQSDQVVTKDTQSVGFSLTGTLHAHWNPDLPTLTSNLIGISSQVVNSVFQSDPGITDARVKIFPPWEGYLPTDLSKIHIEVQ